MDRLSCFSLRSCGLLILAVISFSLSASSMACDEPDVRIQIKKDTPLTFEFSGSGYLDFFVLMEIVPENLANPQQPVKNRVLWQIWPKTSLDGQLPLTPVTYGKVPSGFFQKIPEDGPPPSLEEGKVYQAGGPPVVVPKGSVRFKIQDGKIITLSNSF